MDITFIIPGSNLSGGIRIVAEHAQMLHERGHEVTVVAGRPRKPTVRSRVRAGLRGQFKLSTADGPTHLDNVPYRVYTVEHAGAIVADDVPDADLILATWWETAEWVWAMPESKGIKVSLLQGYEAFPWISKDRVDSVWKLPMQKIVVSKWLDTISKNQFGDHSAILIPNGLDTSAFRFVERGLSGQRVVGVVSSPHSFKRFDLACQVIEELRNRGRACVFRVFGASPVDERMLPEGTLFEITPSQRRIAEIYASCDCWLFTSDKEGYGLPLLEALSSGTPVVATPAGAAEELLASGAGRLVDSANPKILADAIDEILSLDDDSWRTLSTLARAEAEKHSWEIIGGKMESALLQILDES